MSASASAPAVALRCVIQSQDLLGESPLWCEQTQCLLWLDIDNGHLHRLHLATGRHDRFTFDARYVGALALTPTPGQVLIALDAALYRFSLGTGALELVAQVEPAARDTRLNDGRCDAKGRLWIGTMDNQLTRPIGAFYRVDPDGQVRQQFEDVIVANSVALSPEQDRLYFSDTRRFTTWRFDLNLDQGRLTHRQVFQDYSETRIRPDGACVDAAGFVWNALFAAGRVVRYAPCGALDRVIELPTTNPTCVCLGGPQLKTLFITTARKFLTRSQLRNEPLAGAVLAIDVDTAGLPEHRFGG